MLKIWGELGRRMSAKFGTRLGGRFGERLGERFDYMRILSLAASKF